MSPSPGSDLSSDAGVVHLASKSRDRKTGRGAAGVLGCAHGGQPRERERVQGADRVGQEHGGGGEPAGDQQGAEQGPAGPHAFSNVLSAAASASAVTLSAATARMCRGGSGRWRPWR